MAAGDVTESAAVLFYDLDCRRAGAWVVIATVSIDCPQGLAHHHRFRVIPIPLFERGFGQILALLDSLIAREIPR